MSSAKFISPPRQNLSEYSTCFSTIYEKCLFYSSWWEQKLFPAQCELQWLFSILCLGSSSLLLGKFPHMCVVIGAQIKTGGPSVHLWRSLSSSLLSDTLPGNYLTYSRCPGHSALVSLLVLWPGNSLQRVNWGNCRTPLICFPSRRDHTFALLNDQCLKTVVSTIYFL